MTRGTHPTVEHAPRIGDALGRYHIIGVLGDGRLGRLYVAKQNGIRGVSKIVALRHVRPEIASAPQFRARFSEAAGAAVRSEHPNVLTVFEMGVAEGRCFISMEYLPGESVASILNQCNTRQSMPPDIAAYVVKQAAAALQYLHDTHESSSRHAELDSSSVFVSHHGTVKCLSLGLRGVIDAASSSEADAALTGARPERAPVDTDANRSTDVSDLGVLLWACLVGDKPLPRAVPSSARPDVPDGLDTILKRSLSADPRERFPSPRALSDALDRYLFQRDPRPTPKHLRRWMEQLFGAERASLQMQIARGREVEAALSRLGAAGPSGNAGQAARAFSTPRPRALWSTSHSVFSQLSRASIVPPRSFERLLGSTLDESSRVTSIPARHIPSSFMLAPASLASAELPPRQTPPPVRAPRTWFIGTLLAACAVLAVGLALIVVTSSEGSLVPVQSAAAPDRRGRVEVRSKPEGAAVFIGGEPTGSSTPVVLRGLTPGRPLQLRVEKAGFASQERKLEVVAGEQTQFFELLPSQGRVLLSGMPADARVYVDDAPVAVERDTPVNLSVGSHVVRVETPSELIFSGTVQVVPGEQTVHVDGDRATP